MKISEIDIKGLYGSYSYKITQLEHQNLLLLTGYNGMGKTTVLNIVKGIADSNLWFFYELPFDEINVCFEDGLSLKMRHTTNDVELQKQFLINLMRILIQKDL